ncbi:MAG: DUF1311 domain-containing protein [Bacteroidetes bacterium]|nr:DUF1311 domain-containing protein [Bacteroidota bacterium]
MKNLFALFFILITSVGFAQTQMEMNEEAYRDFHQSDSVLNRTYSDIIKLYKSDPEFINALKKSQRLWIKFRDAELEMKFPNYKEAGYYGSIHPMCRAYYLKELTDKRIETLMEWRIGGEEGDGCGGSVKLREDFLMDSLLAVAKIHPDQLYKPFDSLDFDKVMAFNFFIDSKTFLPLSTYEVGSIVSNGSLIYSTHFPGVELTKNQINTLNNLFSDTLTFGGEKRACFEPHHAFVFYKGNKIVNAINICLDCNQMNSDFKIPAMEYYIADYGMTDGQLGISFQNGFTESGRTRLINLIRELKLPYVSRKDLKGEKH